MENETDSSSYELVENTSWNPGLGDIYVAHGVSLDFTQDQKIRIGPLILGKRSQYLLQNPTIDDLYPELSGRTPLYTKIQRESMFDTDDFTVRIEQNFGQLGDKGIIQRTIRLSTKIEDHIPGGPSRIPYINEDPLWLSTPLRPRTWMDDHEDIYIHFDKDKIDNGESKGALIKLRLLPLASNEFRAMIYRAHQVELTNERLNELYKKYESLLSHEQKLSKTLSEDSYQPDLIREYLIDLLRFEIAFSDYNYRDSTRKVKLIESIDKNPTSKELLDYQAGLIHRKKALTTIGRKYSNQQSFPAEIISFLTDSPSSISNSAALTENLNSSIPTQSTYTPFLIQGLERYFLDSLSKQDTIDRLLDPEQIALKITNFIARPLPLVSLDGNWHQVVRGIQSALPDMVEIPDLTLIDTLQQLFQSIRNKPFAILRVFGSTKHPEFYIIEGCYLSRDENSLIDSEFTTYIISSPENFIPTANLKR